MSSSQKHHVLQLIEYFETKESSFLTYCTVFGKKIHLQAREMLLGTSDLIYAIAKKQSNSSVIRISPREVIETLNYRVCVFEKIIDKLQKLPDNKSLNAIKYLNCVINFDTQISSIVDLGFKLGERNKFSYEDLQILCEGKSIFYLPYYDKTLNNNGKRETSELINVNASIFRTSPPFFREKKSSPILYIGREKY